MIFCGDIALPFKNAIKIINLPNTLATQQWIGNLEGSLIKHNSKNSEFLKRRIVFNSEEAIQELCTSIHYKLFNIANNHILDAAPLNQTTLSLNKLGVPYIGGGSNLFEAQQEISITDYGKEYILISFGWEAIKCIYASKKTEGVNPYKKDEVLHQAKRMLDKYSNQRIICLFHWNYELELYPQPFDRELAHKLIDMGVFAVIGCHAHRVQPIEIYKGKPIVYGLGNFLFPQSIYMNGNLKFPDFTLPEITFEIDEHDNFIVHQFIFDRDTSTLTYIGKKTVKTAPFDSLSPTDYIKFFKLHRIQKKALPIILYDDNKCIHRLKINWINLRNNLISVLVNNKKIFKLAKSFMAKIYDNKNN